MTPKSSQTKERLIQAAREILIESGEGSASVKTIAQRAGVNHGLVHHYFGSKEQLWVAVVEFEAEAIHQGMASKTGMDGEKFLNEFYLPEMVANSERLHLMIELIAVAKKYPPVTEALAKVMTLRRETMRKIFHLEDTALPTLLMGAWLGMAIQSSLDPNLPIQASGQHLIRMIQVFKQQG